MKFACAGMFFAGGIRCDVDVDDDVGHCWTVGCSTLFKVSQDRGGVVRGGVVAPDWIHQDFSAALGNGLFFLEQGKEKIGFAHTCTSLPTARTRYC